ncbi:TolC family protein [Paenibacillus sp. M1]|uniref:TolC family protein n=1 Tax=Paenibacillus haidiansis TaxID=1574488 RepID=A0ABU7VWC5_9BACL
MKKWIIGPLAVSLLFGSSQFVSAANNPLKDLKRVDSLSLNSAIDMAVDNSYNLALLGLKFSALDNKQGDLEAQKDELSVTGSVYKYKLPTDPMDILTDPTYRIPEDATPDQLLWLGTTIEANTVINGMMDGISDIVDGMNKLVRSQRNQLEVAIEQMDTNKKKTLLETDKAREGAILQVTSQYVTLLSEKEQIATTKEYVALLENDVRRAQILESYGGGSKENIVKAERAVRTQNEQLNILEKKYQADLVQLSYDLGIEYNPDLVLEDIPLPELQPVERKDTNRILAKSYDLKMKDKEIDQAKWEETHTDTASDDGEDFLELSTRIAKLQGEQLYVEQAKKVDQIYNDAETAYLGAVTADNEYQDVLFDYNNNNIRYEKGFISAFDMNKLKFTLTQAETKANLTKLKYFVITRQVEAMENGLII